MNEKDKAIAQAMASIQNRLRHVYNQGFEDGRKAERKTGKWVVWKDCEGKTREITCSECGCQRRTWVNPNYCEDCGAKMEADE